MNTAAAILLLQLASVPAGEAILKRVETALAPVEDYTVALSIVADLEQVNIPPMDATLYFKKPDKVHVASESFALLPKDAFSLTPSMILKRFSVTEVLPESVGGKKVYRLQLAARDERMRVREAWLQVSAERWTIERGELRLAENRTLALEYAYTRIKNVWLPSEMRLSFSQPPAAQENSPLLDQKPVQGSRRLPLRGSVLIRYSGYRLNTGLPDSVFPATSEPAAAEHVQH
jgi:hypothetical protein